MRFNREVQIERRPVRYERNSPGRAYVSRSAGRKKSWHTHFAGETSLYGNHRVGRFRQRRRGEKRDCGQFVDVIGQTGQTCRPGGPGCGRCGRPYLIWYFEPSPHLDGFHRTTGRRPQRGTPASLGASVSSTDSRNRRYPGNRKSSLRQEKAPDPPLPAVGSRRQGKRREPTHRRQRTHAASQHRHTPGCGHGQ